MAFINFILYSSQSHRQIANDSLEIARQSGQFDNVHGYTREWLEQTEFYQQNKSILDQSRGSGVWAWKAYIILETLKQCDHNDIVLYTDCCDWLQEHHDLRKFLSNRMQNTDILLTAGAFPNHQYTKRDAFVLMECDNEDYWNDIQVEAGIIVVKNTPFSRYFITSWLNYCKDERILTDMPNTCGLPNFNTFIDHRHDQSILSLLAKDYNIERTNEMRKFVHCNAIIVNS